MTTSLQAESCFSLPDRIHVLNVDLITSTTSVSEEPPGAYADKEIRSIAAKHLGVSEQILLIALNEMEQMPSLEDNHEPVLDETDQASSTEFKIALIHKCTTSIEELVTTFAFYFIENRVLAAYKNFKALAAAVGIDKTVAVDYISDLLVQECRSVCLKLILFELNAAISSKFITSNEIKEISSAYKEMLEDKEYIKYLNYKYPLLRHRITSRFTMNFDACATLLTRFAHDISEIRSEFDNNSKSNDPVTKISCTLGDSHAGAKRVAIIAFESGKRVVYKPRSVSGEAAFQKLISWINSKATLPELRALRVSDRDSYGWVEFVAHTDLTSTTNIQAYFYKYGILVALTYLFCVTDLHYENVIATDEGPIAVDLESVAQPLWYVDDVDSSQPKQFIMEMEYVASTALYTALVDPSFLERTLSGAPTNPTATPGVPHKLRFNTETAEVEEEAAADEWHSAHVPRYGHSGVAFTPYISDMINGFRDAYDLIAAHRFELISGKIGDFLANTNERVIFRYTRSYSSIIEAIYSPYALQSARNSSELISNIWRVVARIDAIGIIVPSEIRDIWQGDVPYFHGNTASRIVVDSRGVLLSGVLGDTGLSAVRRRLVAMSLADRDLQTTLLRYSLHQKGFGSLPQKSGTSNFGDSNGALTIHGRAELPQLIQLIMSRLVVDHNKVLFMEPVCGHDLVTKFGNIPTGLYSGLAGILLSLAYFNHVATAKILPEKLHNVASLMTLAATDAEMNIGLANGMSGFVYVCSHLGTLWRDGTFIEIAEYFARKIASVIFRDRYFDIYSGAAGAVVALDTLAAVTRSQTVLEILEHVADHLIDFKIHTTDGAAWMSSIPSMGPTTGFAHGASGIGYALLRARKRLKVAKYDDTIRGVESFIKSCFQPSLMTWTECVGDTVDVPFNGWCHGVHGISLFYDELYREFGDDRYGEYLELGLESSIRHAQLENDSLCHGNLGNIDLLISGVSLHQTVECVARQRCVIEEARRVLEERSFICGTDRQHVSLSLFTGLAGWIYQDARIDYPGVIPSIVRFGPPSSDFRNVNS